MTEKLAQWKDNQGVHSIMKVFSYRNVNKDHLIQSILH